MGFIFLDVFQYFVFLQADCITIVIAVRAFSHGSTIPCG